MSQVDVADPLASRYLHSRLTSKSAEVLRMLRASFLATELAQAMFHTCKGELTTTRSEKSCTFVLQFKYLALVSFLARG